MHLISGSQKGAFKQLEGTGRLADPRYGSIGGDETAGRLEWELLSGPAVSYIRNPIRKDRDLRSFFHPMR